MFHSKPKRSDALNSALRQVAVSVLSLGIFLSHLGSAKAAPIAPVAPLVSTPTETTPSPAIVPSTSLTEAPTTRPIPAPRPAAPRPKPRLTSDAALAQPIVRQSSGPAVSADDIASFTDSLIPALMQRDHVLGASVAVVQGDTTLFLKGYGLDRLSPARQVDPNSSLFRLGSITKTFTWVVARQEIETRRIDLDGPISKYLPEDVFSEKQSPYKPLRLRDLMNHSAGFEDKGLGHLFRLNVGQIESTDRYLRRHAPARVRDRGQFSSYSNYGAALAARALVQTTRSKDVPSMMEARIFTPLGLTSTSLREPYDPSALSGEAIDGGLPAPLSKTLSARLSQGYVWSGAAYVPKPFDHAVPLAGALSGSSTSSDMARYMSLLLGNGQLNGIQLFDAGSAKAFRTPLLVMPNGYNGWASGFMVRETSQGVKTYGHSGSTLWFNANMILIPDLDIGIFIATNTDTGDGLVRAYPELLIRHLEGAGPLLPRQPTAAQSFAKNKGYYESLRGHYVSTRRTYGGLEGAITRLINTVEVDIDAEGRLIIATQDGLSSFVPTQVRGFFQPQDVSPSGAQIGSEGLHFLFKPNRSEAIGFETTANMARYERIGWVHQPETLRNATFVLLLSCVLVLMGVGRNNQARDRPTSEQVQASYVSYAIALVWILAIIIFFSWRAGLDDAPSSLFTSWPSGSLRLASTLAMVATLGTLFQIVTLYRVYQEANFHSDGWALWQKIMHTLVHIGWLGFAGLLMWWGALSW
jgi:CubicO group peptidase (beta-lactamase class C family)